MAPALIELGEDHVIPEITERQAWNSLQQIPGVTFEESTIESKDQSKKIYTLPETIYKVCHVINKPSVSLLIWSLGRLSEQGAFAIYLQVLEVYW